MRFQATCKLGFEALVTRQLRDLGIEVVKTEDARVTFEGGFDAMARALLWLRTAERVLLVCASFHAETFDELFERTKATDWKPFLTPQTTIHVTGKSAKSKLFSVSDCQSIVKKAIVESLKAAYHRGDIPEGGAEIIVEAGLLRDEVTLALDCCGAGLSRRGYRTWNVAAPLSETLGAGIVLLSRYFGRDAFVDPMCGSGTMPIEAAMIANRIAPGRGRSFAAERWPFLPVEAFASARAEADDMRTFRPTEICGSDIDERCIEVCKKHADNAGVSVTWRVCPLSDLTLSSARGTLVCNPPYGERMLDRSGAEALCREMRGVFDRYPGWSKNIFSGMQQFEQVYGRRADKRRKLTNGGMVCNLYQYFGGNEA